LAVATDGRNRSAPISGGQAVVTGKLEAGGQARDGRVKK
jgi:hypothetical protein